MLKPFLTSKSIWSYNPSPTGCVLYLPLWHPSLSGPVFSSIDPYGHTCTVTGATWGIQGRTFDGDGDFIGVSSDVFHQLSQISIVGIVTPTLSGDTELLFQIHNGTDMVQVTSTTQMTSGQKYHIGCVYDGATMTLYLDGVVDGTPQAQTGSAVWVAILANGVSTTYSGLEIEALVFNRGLTAGEVINHKQITNWR